MTIYGTYDYRLIAYKFKKRHGLDLDFFSNKSDLNFDAKISFSADFVTHFVKIKNALEELRMV